MSWNPVHNTIELDKDIFVETPTFKLMSEKDIVFGEDPFAVSVAVSLCNLQPIGPSDYVTTCIISEKHIGAIYNSLKGA